MSHLSVRPRGPILLFVSLLITALAGCDPEEQWLDDSSGFVYSFEKDDSTAEVRFYDIARRAQHVVWSGRNRFGSHLDTADGLFYLIEPRREPGDEFVSCRISVYGVNSDRMVRSTRWMKWSGNRSQDSRLGLIKVPNRQSHFLLFDVANNAILNTDAPSLIDIPDSLLEIVPDGSGFVATSESVSKSWQDSLNGRRKLDLPAIEKLCGEAVSFVDLNGVRHRMTWDDAAIRRVAALYDKQLKVATASAKSADAHYDDLIPITWRKWLGDGTGKEERSGAMRLLLGDANGAMQIDLERRTVTEPAGPVAAAAKKAAEFSQMPRPEPPGLVVKLKDVEYRSQALENPTREKPFYIVRLEVRWPADGKTKTLLDRVRVGTMPTCKKTSPDGLYAVVQYEEPEKEKNEKISRVHFVIVDHAGHIVDSLFFEHCDSNRSESVEPGLPDDAEIGKK